MKMEQFFLAVRSDLGHSNKGLEKVIFFASFSTTQTYYLRLLKIIPNVTIEQLSEVLKQQKSGTEAKPAAQ